MAERKDAVPILGLRAENQSLFQHFKKTKYFIVHELMILNIIYFLGVPSRRPSGPRSEQNRRALEGATIRGSLSTRPLSADWRTPAASLGPPNKSGDVNPLLIADAPHILKSLRRENISPLIFFTFALWNL
jgi:hypothetical protein